MGRDVFEEDEVRQDGRKREGSRRRVEKWKVKCGRGVNKEER